METRAARHTLPARFVAPFTAGAMIAQLVASSACRDALFLAWFPVTALPYFMAAAAILSFPAAQGVSHLLSRLGPARTAPALFAASGTLFVLEWWLLSRQPRAAAIALYLHVSVLAAIAVSVFWSLLNERFDPHAARVNLSRVAAGATIGGLAGGLGVERLALLLSPGGLLLVLSSCGVACVAGTLALSAGMPDGRREENGRAESGGGWAQLRGNPYLRDLVAISALSAVVGTLFDYVLKADLAAYSADPQRLVGIFGVFYAVTGIAAFLVLALAGRTALDRLGVAGSIASHGLVVGAAGLASLVVPPPWRSLVTRGLDVTARNSVFRTGYELLYTPLPEASKRAAKASIDVVWDGVGKGVAAGVILALTRLAPAHALIALNLAGVLAAAAELLATRRLPSAYLIALVDRLRRGGKLRRAAHFTIDDFTVVYSSGVLDRTAVLRLPDVTSPVRTRPAEAAPRDPVVAALVELRSGDARRIRAALRDMPADPLLVAATIPLLGQTGIVKDVVAALRERGARTPGPLVDALLDAGTPEVVRRRLPLALKLHGSKRAFDGLVNGLADASFTVRLRCGQALLELTGEHTDLVVPAAAALTAADRELTGPAGNEQALEHVFNLLALALDRQAIDIARGAFEDDDAYLRGTALEYLATVLPSTLLAKLEPRLGMPVPPAGRRRVAGEARDDLLRASEVSRLRRRGEPP